MWAQSTLLTLTGVKLSRSFKSLNSTGTSDGAAGGSETVNGQAADFSDPEEETILETCDNIFKQKSDQFQYR